MSAKSVKKLIDIGANLTDSVYRGIYNGSQKHENDLKEVISRAANHGLEKIIITGGSLDDSKNAIEIAKTHHMLHCTVGCHPTRCMELDACGGDENYLNELKTLILDNKDKVVAVGECGLDYDRLQFCPKDIQKKYFERQFELAEFSHLPMFLHCRNSAEDLVKIIKQNRDRFSGGVVHSFDGSKEDAEEIMAQDLYIGINGCSLKTDRNLEVMSSIPLDRLMIETDCPWCEIRPSHAGHKHVQTDFQTKKKERFEYGTMVKNRTEPAHLLQVLEVVASYRGEDVANVAEITYQNANKLFFK